MSKSQTPAHGMICPHCGKTSSEVINSRPYGFKGFNGQMRRRRCVDCKKRFTTLEITERQLVDFGNDRESMRLIRTILLTGRPA